MNRKKEIVKYGDNVNRQILLEIEFVIADTIRDHSRKPLGILDIMSALGGFERNLSLLGMMMVKAISGNAFFLKAI